MPANRFKVSLILAEYNLLVLDEKWCKKYPMVIKSWQWGNLSTYFKFSKEIRTLIYTTNPIESFHRQVRKYTKTKGRFTSDNALLLFCAINKIVGKWTIGLSQLDIYFPGRVSFGD